VSQLYRNNRKLRTRSVNSSAEKGPKMRLMCLWVWVPECNVLAELHCLVKGTIHNTNWTLFYYTYAGLVCFISLLKTIL
jgi:hypothetical protein